MFTYHQLLDGRSLQSAQLFDWRELNRCDFQHFELSKLDAEDFVNDERCMPDHDEFTWETPLNSTLRRVDVFHPVFSLSNFIFIDLDDRVVQAISDIEADFFFEANENFWYRQ